MGVGKVGVAEMRTIRYKHDQAILLEVNLHFQNFIVGFDKSVTLWVVSSGSSYVNT